MGEAPTLHGILRAHLADCASSWSIGGHGAIAEFHWLPGEAPGPSAGDLAAASPGGAIALALRDDAVPFAYQRLSRHPDRWLQGVTLCLPWRRARRAGRRVLTELGPDHGAVRAEDRGAVLFDLGLGLPHVDACVRSRDPALLGALRAALGRSLLAPGNPAMAAIQAASPHRVFVSALGRVEVYQRIGRADAHPPTPEGPHTHVLPRLLKAGPPRDAGADAPAHHRACVSLYPAHPLVDRLGRRKAFDAAARDAFAELLQRWGDPRHVAEKRRAARAMADGLAAGRYRPPADPRGRRALRIAIREHAQAGGDPATVEDWRRRFDRTRPPAKPHLAH